MSSTVHFDMTLMATSNVVPAQIMKRVFMECVKEMSGELKGSSLFVGGSYIGSLHVGERIILSYDSDLRQSEKRGELRGLFTRRLAVAQRDYLYELEEKEKRLKESEAAEASLLDELAELEKSKVLSQKAMQRQCKPECEAMKEELCEAAEMKGYDVIEEKTEQGIQLQFIRREY